MRIALAILILVAPLLLFAGTVRLRVTADGIETFGGYRPLGAAGRWQYGGRGSALRIEPGRMVAAFRASEADPVAPEGPPAPIMVGIEVSGPTNVAEGATAQYGCTADYSDLTTGSVEAVWSVEGASATISSNGLLAAGAVESNMVVAVTAAHAGFVDALDVEVVAP